MDMKKGYSGKITEEGKHTSDSNDTMLKPIIKWNLTPFVLAVG